MFVSCSIFEGEDHRTTGKDHEQKEDNNINIGSIFDGDLKINRSVTKGKGKDQKSGKIDEVEIGHFQTPLLDKSEPRVHNIKLAAKKLDQYKVDPGDEFSFNRVVGKRTSEKGYEEAPIIILESGSPENSEALGGGICQLSSTLYNAVLKANLKVTERHPHSKKVSYVDEGQDATIDFNRYDLKFINTRDKPITLKIRVKEDTVSVFIYENRLRENE